jgi:hypothetical protein
MLRCEPLMGGLLMAGRMRPAKIIPWAVAGIAWAANAVADFGPPRWASAGSGRFLDGAAICLTVWALLSVYSVRGHAGERLVSDGEYHRTEEAIARGVAVAAGEQAGGNPASGHRALRSI